MRILEKIYFSSYSTGSKFTAEEWLETRDFTRKSKDFKEFIKRHDKD